MCFLLLTYIVYVYIATPIFKNSSKHSVANYRPISLTCIAVKTLERLLHSNLTNSGRQAESPSTWLPEGPLLPNPPARDSP